MSISKTAFMLLVNTVVWRCIECVIYHGLGMRKK